MNEVACKNNNWIDLSKLPKKNGIGKYKGRKVYDWANCKNVVVKFQYENIIDTLEIIKRYDMSYLIIKYKNFEYKIHHKSLEACMLGRILTKKYPMTSEEIEIQKKQRLGLTKKNNQGCLMKIIEYNTTKDITVEFQDDYRFKKKCEWTNFISGSIENPYFPAIYNIGIVGDVQIKNNGKYIKEYQAWCDILKRSFSTDLKRRRPTYENVICCNEWLYFENFYNWIIQQDNYVQWKNGDKWAVDKDILIKGNKIYSPETCCLVSPEINALFTKRQNCRGILPIGVIKYKNKYSAQCCDGTGKQIKLGYFNNPIDAFYAYKRDKEKCIRDIAQKSFLKNEITKACYEAMINYVVEITD